MQTAFINKWHVKEFWDHIATRAEANTKYWRQSNEYGSLDDDTRFSKEISEAVKRKAMIYSLS